MDKVIADRLKDISEQMINRRNMPIEDKTAFCLDGDLQFMFEAEALRANNQCIQWGLMLREIVRDAG